MTPGKQAPAEKTPADNKQAARSRRTTERLLAEARRLFAEHGFAGASAEQVVAAAGVTRGRCIITLTARRACSGRWWSRCRRRSSSG